MTNNHTLPDDAPVHIFIGGHRGDNFARGRGYETTAAQARVDAKAAIANDSPSEVLVRALADPCFAYRWLPSHAFLGIEQGWRTQHLLGYCSLPCARRRR